MIKRDVRTGTREGQKELDPVVEAVRAKLRERSVRGLAKYGVSVADADLTPLDWLRHAQEEALDLAVYLERLLGQLRRLEGNSARYFQLLYAVGNKYENEDRHETALRYIRQAEQAHAQRPEFVPSDYGDCNNCGLMLAEHEQKRWCPSKAPSVPSGNEVR